MIRKHCMQVLPAMTVFIIALIVMPPDQGFAKAGDVIAQIGSPCPKPQDLAWDGQHLWVLDGRTNRIYKVDPKDGAVISEMDAVVARPVGVAWDGGRLWISDEENKTIARVETEKGTLSRIMNAPVVMVHPNQQEKIQLSGLAWDGKHLWSGCIAGWSSRVYRVDAADGAVGKFFFTLGAPNAVEAGGGSLWTASNNRGRRPGVIYQYEADGSALVGQFDAPGNYPSGLAYDGEHLWYADEETNTIYKLSLQ